MGNLSLHGSSSGIIDWTNSMEQTYEFYSVEPYTWTDVNKIDTIKSCSITYDSTTDTFMSASIDTSEEVNEQYIRVYLVAKQGKNVERIALGTFLVQSPSYSFNGKVFDRSCDAYSPLIELKEKYPPYGYAIQAGTNIMDKVVQLIEDNSRCRVINSGTGTDESIIRRDYVSSGSEDLLTFITGLLKYADKVIRVDALGRIYFTKIPKLESLVAKKTFDTNAGSILMADISVDRDIYGIPNVLEVYYKSGSGTLVSVVENNDSSSVTSIQNRGRRIVSRETDPSFAGAVGQATLDEYAKKRLEELTKVKFSVTYTHGYFPLKVDEGVELDYVQSGMKYKTALITNQTIECKTGCTVSETAIFEERV